MKANPEGYLPYLLEIRRRLLSTIFIFVLASLAGFIFYEHIITLTLNFFHLQGVNIVFTTPFQFFTLALNCALVVGVITIIPVLLFQVMSFLKPALTPKEYRLILTSLPVALILFTFGFIYGVAIMKYVVQLFYQSSIKLQIGNILDIEKFLSQVLITGLLMGVAFLFPIVMTVIMQLKIVPLSLFTQGRSIAYIIGIIFVIFLPPPDLISDVILFAPLVVLYELTLILNRYLLNNPSYVRR